jgi:uncharacterized protein YdhG (YjbR/CyaY superfamily)
MTASNQPQTINEYIAQFPPDIQQKLTEIRSIIRTNAPEATETINYAVPTFKLNGNLVHYAAFKNHIGFYPGSSGVAHFQAEINSYKSAKGSIQFPFSRPLPADLIGQIVRFRVMEQQHKNR